MSLQIRQLDKQETEQLHKASDKYCLNVRSVGTEQGDYYTLYTLHDLENAFEAGAIWGREELDCEDCKALRWIGELLKCCYTWIIVFYYYI